VLRSLHSRSVAEVDTEEAVVVAVSMEEVVAEAASTVAEGEAADSMEAVAAERIGAVVVHIAAAVVRIAADRRVAPLEVRTAEAVGMRRADTAAERMAERVRME
jgi:hypothetical protein